MRRFLFFVGLYGFLIGFFCAQGVHSIRSRDQFNWSPSIGIRPKRRFAWLEGRIAKGTLLAVGVGLLAFGWYRQVARDCGIGVFLLATTLTYWLCIKRRP